MNKLLYIFGCGGHARSVVDVVISNSAKKPEIVFIDENARPREKIYGYKVMKPERGGYLASSSDFFIAIGDNITRTNMLNTHDNKAVSIISNDTVIATDVEIEDGVFIGHEAYIGPLSIIKKGSIVNTRAILEHEVSLGKGAQVAPGAIIGGRVNIGNNTFVGLGARIIDNVDICDDVVIGASAVVVDSISEAGTYVGIPARRIK